MNTNIRGIKGLNCFDSAIVSCAQLFEKSDYPLSFRKNIDFNLKPFDKDNLVGDLISLGSDKYFISKEIADICGIKLTTVQPFIKEQIIAQLRPIVNKNPVILMVDLFGCKWTRFYNISHVSHAIVVLSETKNKDGVLFIDTNFSSKIEFINYYDLKKVYIEHLLITVNEVQDVLSKKKYLYDSVNYLQTKNYCNSIIEYISILKDNFVFEKEVYGDHPFDSPIIGNMYELTAGRKAYLEFLHYIAKLNIEEINKPIDLFEKSVKMWELSLSVLVRSFYDKKSIINKTISYFYEIFNYESEAIKLLNSIVENKTTVF